MSDFDYNTGISSLPQISYRRQVSKIIPQENSSYLDINTNIQKALHTQEAPMMSKIGPAAITIKPLLSLADTLMLENTLQESFSSRSSRSAIQKLTNVRSEVYNPVLVPTEGHRYPTVEEKLPFSFHRAFIAPLVKLLSSHRKEDRRQGVSAVLAFSVSFHNLVSETEAPRESLNEPYFKLGAGFTQSQFEGQWISKVCDTPGFVLEDFALGDCITLHLLYLLLGLIKSNELSSNEVLSLLKAFKEMLKSPNFLQVIKSGIENFEDFDFFSTLLSLPEHQLESLDLLSMLLPRFPHPKLVKALLEFLVKSDVQAQQYVLTLLKALFLPISPVGDLFCASKEENLLKNYIFSRDENSEVLSQMKDFLQQRNFQELIFGSLVYFMSTSLPHSITFISFLSLCALENSHELLIARLISARESVFIYGALLHSLRSLEVRFDIDGAVKTFTILMRDFTENLLNGIKMLCLEFNQEFKGDIQNMEDLVTHNLAFLSPTLAALLRSFWFTIGNDFIRVSEHILSYHEDGDLRNCVEQARQIYTK